MRVIVSIKDAHVVNVSRFALLFMVVGLLLTFISYANRTPNWTYEAVGTGLAAAIFTSCIVFSEWRKKVAREFFEAFELEMPRDAKRRTIVQPYVNAQLKKQAEIWKGACDQETAFLNEMRRLSLADKTTTERNLKAQEGHEAAIEETGEAFWAKHKIARNAGFEVFRKRIEYLTLL